MGRRGKPPRSTAAKYAAVSVEGISELSIGRHRLLHKSPTPGGKRSTLISRKRQRSQSPRPAAAAAIAGIRFGRFGISPRRRSTSRKRLPKGEGSIVSGPANLCSSQFAAGIGGAIISTKILTLRHMEDDIEKAGSAKKQKTVSEKVVPVKNDLKVKKKLPLKKVESSRSDEYSSESEDEVMVQQKKAARSSKQESSSDSSDESSSDDEPAKKPAAASKKPAALASNGSKNDKSDSCSDEHDDVMFQPKKAAQSAKQESHHSDNSGESSSGKELAKKSAAASKKLAALANNASKSMKLDSSSSDIGDGADDGSSSGAAKPASKVAKKESGDDDDSSEESSGSDEENDRQVSVANSKKNEPKTAASSSHQATTRSRTLIVANLSYSVKNEQVKQFFEEAGEVIDIRFATSDDGSFKGSTHVEFATTEAAEKAYKLNGRDLAGRPVRLDFACERGTITPGSRRDNSSFKKPGQSSSYAAFIRGFDSSLGEDENRRSLQQHLSSCGEITRVSIAKDYDTCASKGIADMEFIDKSSLPKALELTGSDLGGCSLSVDEAKPSPDNRDGADSDRGCGQSGAPPRQSAGTLSAECWHT
ncbi:nucleolin 2 isoform X3 [Triticum aestivum]|uniref:nucleolin 2 isoform X3 n=1 Tax=Triticum aestivum TaxID=4565 RepID=UPI001D020DDA|nr:nucleolin 2-like isoform X3 [Triticum aestivum]